MARLKTSFLITQSRVVSKDLDEPQVIIENSATIDNAANLHVVMNAQRYAFENNVRRRDLFVRLVGKVGI
jgi:hypothetical protein